MEHVIGRTLTKNANYTQKQVDLPCFEQSVRLGNGNIGKESPEEQLLQMQEAFSHTISIEKTQKGRSFIPKTVKYVGRNLLRRY